MKPETPLGTATEVWDFLTKQAGLDPSGYDEGLVEELCAQLGGIDPTRSVARQLSKRGISVETIVSSFLRTLQPYAAMLSKIAAFFEKHGIRRTKLALRVRFDFDQAPTDLEFDLDHFREVLRSWQRAWAQCQVTVWNTNQLWRLHSILREAFLDPYQRFASHSELDEYMRCWGANQWPTSRPAPPFTGKREVDEVIDTIWRVWDSVHHACEQASSDPKALRDAVFCNRQASDAVREEFLGWDKNALAGLTSDRWHSSVAEGLWTWAEEWAAAPASDESRKAQEVFDKLGDFLRNIPTERIRTERWQEVFEEILSLPIWKHRHELYAAWVMTEIHRAIEQHKPTVHHENGQLLIRFSGTHVSTAGSTEGRLYVVSEYRSPLANPIGKGRSSSIQPDYRVLIEPGIWPESSLLVVECKQYHKASRKNFVEALDDYTAGCPKALVILVNYGKADPGLIDGIPVGRSSRASVIGEFRPDRADKIRDFHLAVQEALPSPASTGFRSNECVACDRLVIDVSGSMAGAVKADGFSCVLTFLIQAFCPNEIYAVDTGVVRVWQREQFQTEEFLSLSFNGSTNLLAALVDDVAKTVLVTDEDGHDQMKNAGRIPFVSLLVSTKREDWSFKMKEQT